MWIFDLIKMSLININEVHQNEILDIQYSPIEDIRDNRCKMLATCSKDHSIKLFEFKKEFEEIKHIKDHDSAVVSIKFMTEDHESDLKLISADAKGTVIVRSIDEDLNITEPVRRDMPGSKIYCMAANESNLIIGMDKKVQMAQIRSNNSLVLK